MLGTIKYHQAETTVEPKLVNKLGTRLRVRGPYRCLIVDVAGFPNRFCILFYSTVSRGPYGQKVEFSASAIMI
jgi:hypothetical protein